MVKDISVIKTDIESDLIEKIEPVMVSMGYALRDIEVVGGAANPTIRVTLEFADESPIGIEDCSKVHYALSPMFDVWDPVPGNYTLEVSSPGEKPPLRLLRHFQQAVGEEIKFQTAEALPMTPPMKPRRNWVGILKSINEEQGSLTLVDDFGEHEVPIAQIRNANWHRDWSMKNSKEKR